MTPHLLTTPPLGPEAAGVSLSSDVLVIGAGPVGLHAAFYVGLRGLSVRLIDAQPEPGGQLSALYPDKVVYDLPGLPATRAGNDRGRAGAAARAVRAGLPPG